MIREQQKVLYTILIIIDIFVITIAFLISLHIREHFNEFYHLNFIPSSIVVSEFNYGKELFLHIYPLSLITWILVLWSVGFYKSFRTRSYLREFWLIFRAAILTILAFGSLTYILKIQLISRAFLLIFAFISSAFLFLNRALTIKISHSLRKRGYNYRQILIVGTGPRAKRFLSIIFKHSEWGLRIMGLLDIDPNRIGKRYFGIKCIGTLDDIQEILKKYVVDEVACVVPRTWLNRLQNLVSVCELQGIKVNLAGDLFNLNVAHTIQRDLDGFPLMTFETTLVKEWDLVIKRFVDIIVSLLSLIILSPVLITTMILIKLTSPGPIFFRQKRVGLNGRVFNLHKFRSMYQDAAKQLENIKQLNEMDGPVFKIKNDPRITPLGKILRRLSIDELPQLYDVLVGNMSLVGPRPALPDEVKQYEPWQKRRLSMRPGITCLWQVMGRNKISFKRWMELDLQYIDHWSLWLDLKILMRTFPVVVLGYGAQ